MLLAFSLVGCAVSKNPNPMIRYGANVGASMAVPGVVGLVGVGVLGSLLDENDDDYLDDDECDSRCSDDFLAAVGITAGIAGIGFLAGALLGGTIGFFKWMFNGFENDDVQQNEMPEEVLAPE